jgi:cupin superfamily acireductone dioxygenase involved in methionine salvage
MCYAYAKNADCMSAISSIPAGRYNLYISALLYNRETNFITTSYGLIINVNNDNPNFDTVVDRSWVENNRKLDAESTLFVQGHIEVFFVGGNNTIQVKSKVASNLSNYSNRHHVNVCLKYVEPVAA